jgi:TrmH family RNA methyltransferase
MAKRMMQATPITSLQNPIVKRLVKLRTDQQYRYAENSVIIEGIKPIQEVCKEHPAQILVVTHESKIPEGIDVKQLYLVNDAIMHKISGMQSPEGMIAEVAMPQPSSLEKCRTVIALDRVNDPANMGTLLRTALALGWEGAFILNDSCDPYNEKALRAARGATFRLPMRKGSWKELQQLAIANQWEPLVADIDGNDPKALLKCEKRLLILGNEAQGASVEAIAFCRKIAIPMSGKMESLNVAVAGGILMYLLRSE